MTKSLPIPSLTYAQLLKAIKKEIAEGKEIIQKTQAEKYWRIGNFISDYVLNGKDRAKYGEHIFDKLGEDLKIDKRTLHHAVEFSHKFPIVSARSQLPWTLFRQLLSLPDPSDRRKLAEKARRENLTSRELEQEIKKHKVAVATEGPIHQLKLTRGKLYTYTIDEFKRDKTQEDIKAIDCGFNVFYELKLAQLARFAKDQIVETDKNDATYSVKSSERTAKDLYTFKAGIERIIDGDTLLTHVDLGFGTWKEHKLRFRGIDVPEVSTPQGERAKRFIEERLKQCAFVIIKTYKEEKYGRYLVDVFYLPGEEDAIKVAAEGIYLNQELLDNRLAVKW